MHLDEEEKRRKQENLASGEANIYRRDRPCTGQVLIVGPAFDESASLHSLANLLIDLKAVELKLAIGKGS